MSEKKIIIETILKHYPEFIVLDCFDREYIKISMNIESLAEKKNDKLILISNNKKIINYFNKSNPYLDHDYFFVYKDEYFTFKIGYIDGVISKSLKALIDGDKEECVICYEKTCDRIRCTNCGNNVCENCNHQIIKNHDLKCPMCRIQHFNSYSNKIIC